MLLRNCAKDLHDADPKNVAVVVLTSTRLLEHYGFLNEQYHLVLPKGHVQSDRHCKAEKVPKNLLTKYFFVHLQCWVKGEEACSLPGKTAKENDLHPT